MHQPFLQTKLRKSIFDPKSGWARTEVASEALQGLRERVSFQDPSLRFSPERTCSRRQVPPPPGPAAPSCGAGGPSGRTSLLFWGRGCGLGGRSRPFWGQSFSVRLLQVCSCGSHGTTSRVPYGTSGFSFFPPSSPVAAGQLLLPRPRAFLSPLILPWFSFPQVPGKHTFVRPWGRWQPWGVVSNPLVSCPLSVSSHRGHLEPTTWRPSSAPTARNKVLTPPPHFLKSPGGGTEAAVCWGWSTLRFRLGLRQHWLRPGAELREQRSLRDSLLGLCFLWEGHLGKTKCSLSA